MTKGPRPLHSFRLQQFHLLLLTDSSTSESEGGQMAQGQKPGAECHVKLPAKPVRLCGTFSPSFRNKEECLTPARHPPSFWLYFKSSEGPLRLPYRTMSCRWQCLQDHLAWGRLPGHTTQPKGFSSKLTAQE